MSLFDKVYFSRTWNEVSRRNFTEEEIAAIESIDIVAGDWGFSARVFIAGTDKMTYYGLSKESVELPVGSKLDPKKCVIIELERSGQKVEKLLYTDEPIE